jgi:hypothetical protein
LQIHLAITAQRLTSSPGMPATRRRDDEVAIMMAKVKMYGAALNK